MPSIGSKNCFRSKIIIIFLVFAFVAILSILIYGVVELSDLRSQHTGSRECKNGGTWNDGLQRCDGCRYYTFGNQCEEYMKDCEEGRELFYKGSEIEAKMLIQPNRSDEPFFVQCRFADWGTATYLVRRTNMDNENYNRTWNDFKNGFGDFDGSFFVGLEYMHRLTEYKDYTCKIYVKSEAETSRGDAHYGNFRIGSEAQFYSLRYDSFYGDEGIGDGFTVGTNDTRVRDSPFCTFDRDCGECARTTGSGWWFNTGCSGMNLHLPKTESADHLKWVLNNTVETIYYFDIHLLL